MQADGWDISRGPHRPLHWYADQACYFLTAATLYHRPYFRPDIRKQLWVDEMLHGAGLFTVDLVAWTFMEHHYHAIFRVERGRSLPEFLKRLHGRTATELNRQDDAEGRQIWYEYWERQIHTEGGFWSRVNYIWWNPVKHGFCARPEDWPWTNLHALMADADEQTRAALQRFPAPRKLPGDEW